MKKIFYRRLSTILSIVVILAASIGILSYIYHEVRSSRPGVVANVQVDIGVSEIFSQSEIESAMDVVKNAFVNSGTGWDELVELWYDEYWSIWGVGWRDWDESNAIILQTLSYRGRGFEYNITGRRDLSPWIWFLLRDSPCEPWTIVGGGKTL